MTCECFGFIISNIAVRSERNHIGTVAVVEGNCVYMCALTFLAGLARVARLSLIKEHSLIFFRSGRIVGHCRTYRRKEKRYEKIMNHSEYEPAKQWLFTVACIRTQEPLDITGPIAAAAGSTTSCNEDAPPVAAWSCGRKGTDGMPWKNGTGQLQKKATKQLL